MNATKLLIRMHTEDVLVQLCGAAAAVAGGWFIVNNQAVKVWLRHQLRRIFFVESNGDPAPKAPFCTLTLWYNPRV